MSNNTAHLNSLKPPMTPSPSPPTKVLCVRILWYVFDLKPAVSIFMRRPCRQIHQLIKINSRSCRKRTYALPKETWLKTNLLQRSERRESACRLPPSRRLKGPLQWGTLFHTLLMGNMDHTEPEGKLSSTCTVFAAVGFLHGVSFYLVCHFTF